MVDKIALNEQELQEKLKDMAPEWKVGENEKGVPFIQRVHHASKMSSEHLFRRCSHTR